MLEDKILSDVEMELASGEDKSIGFRVWLYGCQGLDVEVGAFLGITDLSSCLKSQPVPVVVGSSAMPWRFLGLVPSRLSNKMCTSIGLTE